MLVIDTRPVIVVASMNPAETFAQSGAILLGVATPFYNGQSLEVPPRTVLEPDVSVAPLRPPVDGFHYQGTITRVPRHVVHWRIRMPPTSTADSGGWVARNVYAGRLKALIAGLIALERSNGVEVAPRLSQALADISDGGTCTLVLRCYPSFDEVYQHTYRHELQHVADHIWLTRQILGRWDATLAEIHRTGTIAVGKRGSDVAALGSLCSYATSTPAIFAYWWTAMKWSGFRFHATEEGASPLARLVDVSGNTVVVELRARRLLTSTPELARATPHREFCVKGAGICGGEPDLAYGKPEKLRFGLVPARNALHAVA